MIWLYVILGGVLILATLVGRALILAATRPGPGRREQRELAGEREADDFIAALRPLPRPGKDIYTDHTVRLPWTPPLADPLGPFTPGPVVWKPYAPLSTAELDELKERFLAAQGGPVKVLPPDEHTITDEQFEQAKQDVIERFGAIPPSLQRVIDHGGRFARVHPDVKFNARPLLSDEDDEAYDLCAGCRNNAHCDGAIDDCVCTCTWPEDWDEEDEDEEPDPFVGDAPRCCVCRSLRVTYHNYQDQPFCAACANGEGPDPGGHTYDRDIPDWVWLELNKHGPEDCVESIAARAEGGRV